MPESHDLRSRVEKLEERADKMESRLDRIGDELVAEVRRVGTHIKYTFMGLFVVVLLIVYLAIR